MSRRARNLYELVEADELTADEPAAQPQTAADDEAPAPRRSPRIGAGIALICALVVVGVLVGHLRHGTVDGRGIVSAPLRAAPRQRAVVVRHGELRRSHARRRRAHPRPPVRHTGHRHRNTARRAKSAVVPPHSTVVANSTVPARPAPPSPPAARSQLTPAELEFGIEH